MKLLVDMGHPAHVHFFKNMIWNLEDRGHEVKVTARNKEVTLQLLDKYGLEYEMTGEIRNSMFGKSLDLLRKDYRMYRTAKKFKADILTGICNPYVVHAGKLAGRPSVTFTDTEYVKIAGRLTFPYTDTICTPSCFREELDPKKHVRYNSYHELAYLHPNHFKPDPAVLDELGLSRSDRFIVLRFISWGAAHDTNLRGIDKGTEMSVVKSLERYGRVFITSERKLGRKLEAYRITTSPEKIHSLLSYAQMYIGEGATMATESAVLGTPAIHIEAATGEEPCAAGIFMGNFIELRDKYGMLYTYQDQNEALAKATEILRNRKSKTGWKKKRDMLLKDKIDASKWMTEFIENYPQSFNDYMRGVRA